MTPPMHRPLALAVLLLLGGASVVVSQEPLPQPSRPPAPATKRYDLVMLHGLTNKQRWSDAFLAACVERWGSGRVFLVYTNRDAEERAATATRSVPGGSVVVGGTDDTSAGDESVARQAEHVGEIVRRLQAERGLGRQFSIIAHSMGGLVARRYLADHPGVVTGLVTLGTPHGGSPLAKDARWLGFFAHATDAIADLRPERCAAFNARYPAAEAPLAEGGRIYTIRGHADGPDSFGSIGELALGWTLLRTVHGMDNDGLVPSASALLEGAIPLADFPHLDHHCLVRDPEVARRAAEVLP
jgi:triacylglycerol lipase